MNPAAGYLVRKEDYPKGIATADDVERLGALLNPYLSQLSNLTAKGITLADNIACEVQIAQFTHGVASQVSLKKLSAAKGVVLLGCDTGMPVGVLMQPVLDMTASHLPRVNITVWFNNATVANAKIALLLLPEGQLNTALPTFLEAIPKSLLTTAGDMIYASAAGVPARLADVAAGAYLRSGGVGVAPAWLSNPFAEYNTTAAQTITTGTVTIVNYATSVTDTDSAVTTGAAWKFTCPTGKDGDYLVSACATFATSPGTNPALLLYKNGGRTGLLFGPLGGTAFGAGTGTAGATIVTLAATDTIDVRCFHNAGINVNLDGNATDNRITIKRLT